MAEKKKNTAQICTELALPVAEKIGVELWDVRFLKEGASWYLRVFIDKAEGISIDDCTDVSHAIDPVIDEADPIDKSYYLEVCSPGIERELKEDWQIEACEDWDVEVRLYAPLDGAKSYLGKLAGLNEAGEVLLSVEGKEEPLSFPRASIASLKTRFQFD